MSIKNTFPIHPGIGTSEDIQVFLHDDSGKWKPQLKTGWYYLNGQEDYLFALEKTIDITVPALQNTISTSVDLKYISESGNILLDSDTTRYTRVTSNFSAYLPVTPQYNSLYTFSTSGDLVGLTGSDGTDYTSVPSTGMLTERNYYYYDSSNYLCYLNRDPSDPLKEETLFLTYLRDNPSLRQEEILLADSDGAYRVMYDGVFYSSSATGYNPSIYIIGTGTVSVSAVTRNTIFLNSPVAIGTKAAVRYYVDGSYLISTENNITSLKTFRGFEEPATLRYEGAFYDNYCSTDIQLNPLYSGVTPGFIHISQPRHPAEKLSYIRTRVAPLSVISQYRQPVRIVVNAVDTESEPCNNIPIDCWIIRDASPSTIYRPYSIDGNTTNYKGQVNYLWESTPQFLGSFTVCASAMTASGQVLTDSTQFSLVDAPALTSKSNSPKAIIYLNPNKDSQGLQDLYVSLVTQSGIPYPDSLNIRVTCTLGSLYYTGGFSSSGSDTGSKQVLLSFSKDQVKTVTCKYSAISGDEIVAVPQDNLEDSYTSEYKFESAPLYIQ